MFRFNSLSQAIVVSSLLTLGTAHIASAQVVFNATSCGPIAADDTQYHGQDLVVNGCTLSIAGRHQFASLTINKVGNVGGQVTHPAAGDASSGTFPQIPDIGLDLDITGDVTIAPGCSINLAGKGFAAGAGPGAGRTSTDATVKSGGGSYGGNGGSNLGLGYGTLASPLDAGSGGGGDAHAGAGGGALNLNVRGALHLMGTISANGTDASTGGNRGGGSGGSLWIRAGSIDGAGLISAMGGRGQSGSAYGGGGGGGRIALAAGTSTFTGTLRACGGTANGGETGGAGTRLANLNSAALSELVLENCGRSGGTTDFAGMQSLDVNLSVIRGAKLSHPQGQELNLHVAGDATIDGASAFDVSGRGFAAETGDGRGVVSGGAGYGGNGGTSTNAGAVSGTGYGSVETPVTFGSGGGNALAGGAGGGRVNLVVDGTLTVDGTIRSDGLAAQQPPGNAAAASGGGSGGSILIQAGLLAGGATGLVVASGGSGRSFGGGGSGGRVAIYSGTSSFAGKVMACGEVSISGNRGGAGTIWQRQDSLPLGRLTIDNCGKVDGATTEFVGFHQFDADLFLTGGAVLSHPPQTPMALSISGNATIDSLSKFDVSGRGYAPGTGPGAAVGNAGGGYGGVGGLYRGGAQNGAIPGATYGDPQEPVDFGSPGGGTNQGGAGGGAVRLIVAGLLQLDGGLLANGAPVSGTSKSGGGSGGSVYVSAGRIAGIGMVSASGGLGAQFSGGGGGGRVKLASCMPSMFTGMVSKDGAPSVTGPMLGLGAAGTDTSGVSTSNPNDGDCDEVADVIDNCPYIANADQTDSGGVADATNALGSKPDGIGNACQCGDANGDGRVNRTDVIVMTRCLEGLDTCSASGLDGLPGGVAKCEVGQPAGCDQSDVDLVQQTIQGLGTMEQACTAANPPVVQ